MKWKRDGWEGEGEGGKGGERGTGREGGASTYVHVDDVHDRRGPAREADADARGEDLGERVEAEHAADRGERLALERKVRRRARRGAEVEEVVRVVLEDEEVVLLREREHLAPPRLGRGHPRRVPAVLRGGAGV